MNFVCVVWRGVSIVSTLKGWYYMYRLNGNEVVIQKTEEPTPFLNCSMSLVFLKQVSRIEVLMSIEITCGHIFMWNNFIFLSCFTAGRFYVGDFAALFLLLRCIYFLLHFLHSHIITCLCACLLHLIVSYLHSHSSFIFVSLTCSLFLFVYLVFHFHQFYMKNLFWHFL